MSLLEKLIDVVALLWLRVYCSTQPGRTRMTRDTFPVVALYCALWERNSQLQLPAAAAAAAAPGASVIGGFRQFVDNFAVSRRPSYHRSTSSLASSGAGLGPPNSSLMHYDMFCHNYSSVDPDFATTRTNNDESSRYRDWYLKLCCFARTALTNALVQSNFYLHFRFVCHIIKHWAAVAVIQKRDFITRIKYLFINK